MKVLLSIKPEYAEKILAGEKRFEFRKAVPKAEGLKTVVIYATKPVGKVVGEFEVEGILSGRPRVMWSLTSGFAGITRKFFNEYFRGRDTAYAIKVKRAKRYEEPLDLGAVVSSGVAPQSFCYLS
ncbi:ASCH domain-containing protein [Dyella amyloliquefaciens]|uniref:ASCH domain-containing protein n=1 Tax=Dyella amyloliquefaciens TaxID=1770545 RepID=UPI00102E8B33|nr:ASCH domain-containing protein [Dyella amyloliquefaciens]